MAYFAIKVLLPRSRTKLTIIAPLHLETGHPLCGTKTSVKQMTVGEYPEIPKLGSHNSDKYQSLLFHWKECMRAVHANCQSNYPVIQKTNEKKQINKNNKNQTHDKVVSLTSSQDKGGGEHAPLPRYSL